MVSSVSENLTENFPANLAESMTAQRGRPRVGVTTYYQEGTWGVWTSIGAIVPGAYVEAVSAAGATPMLLPPVGEDDSVLELLDGLIVIGGPDVDPSFYGASRHQETVSQPSRDEYEILLSKAALERKMPLFAICRGAQILNVALGGTLHQHLPEITDRADQYRPSPGAYGGVEFTTTPESLCRSLLGERAWSPCYHHQGLDRVADGLVVTASVEDGTVEAVETTDPGWVLGVQFHPEENRKDPRLFEGFVAAAREFATSRDISHAHSEKEFEVP